MSYFLLGITLASIVLIHGGSAQTPAWLVCGTSAGCQNGKFVIAETKDCGPGKHCYIRNSQTVRCGGKDHSWSWGTCSPNRPARTQHVGRLEVGNTTLDNHYSANHVPGWAVALIVVFALLASAGIITTVLLVLRAKKEEGAYRGMISNQSA